MSKNVVVLTPMWWYYKFPQLISNTDCQTKAWNRNHMFLPNRRFSIKTVSGVSFPHPHIAVTSGSFILTVSPVHCRKSTTLGAACKINNWHFVLSLQSLMQSAWVQVLALSPGVIPQHYGIWSHTPHPHINTVKCLQHSRRSSGALSLLLNVQDDKLITKFNSKKKNFRSF